MPAVMYGAHVCTTLVPIFTELLFRDYAKGAGPQTHQERLLLAAIYFPYALCIFGVLLLPECLSLLSLAL